MHPSEKKSKDEVQLFGQSGLTDADRRRTRAKQQQLRVELLEDTETGGEKLKFQEARRRNNGIFEEGVRYPREAVLDGDNVFLITQKAAKDAGRMVRVPRYDADRLVSKLVDKCRTANGSFDWAALGMEAGVCFNAIPSAVSFLNGSLLDGEENPLQVRQRVARAPRVQEDESEERPETIDGHTTRNADQLSAIQQSMRALFKTLKAKVNEEKKRTADVLKDDEDLPEPVRKKLKSREPEICAIQHLFNPDSFTQTVENIFHFSFLIKNGNADISFRRDDLSHAISGGNDLPNMMAGPKVHYKDETSSTPKPEPRQAVLSFTMKDWRRLKAAYDVEKGDLPHRTGAVVQPKSPAKESRKRTPVKKPPPREEDD